MPFSSPEASKQTFNQINQVVSRYLGFLQRKGQLRNVDPQDIISVSAHYLHSGAASVEEAVKKAINDERKAARRNPAPAYGHGDGYDGEDNFQDFSMDDLNSGLYRGLGSHTNQGKFESFCEKRYNLWMEHFNG